METYGKEADICESMQPGEQAPATYKDLFDLFDFILKLHFCIILNLRIIIFYLICSWSYTSLQCGESEYCMKGDKADSKKNPESRGHGVTGAVLRTAHAG